MSNAKDVKKVSKFGGNKGNFAFANIKKFSAKGQFTPIQSGFTPPTIRVTQNKGGGGK